MSKRRSVTYLGMVGLIVVGLIVAACPPPLPTPVEPQVPPAVEEPPPPEPLPIIPMAMGTGSMGAPMFLLGSTLARIMAESPELGVEVTVLATGGMEENMVRLARRDIHLGWISGPVGGLAVGGVGEEFAGRADEFRPLFGIAALPYAGMQAVTPIDLPIHHLRDIRGKSIVIGAAGTASAVHFWPVILEEHGITAADTRLLTKGAGAANDAVNRGLVEARTAAAMPPVASIVDLAMMRPLRILPMDPDAISRIMERIPGTYPVKLPRDIYPGQDNPEEVLSLGWAMILATHDQVCHDRIYNITKAFWEGIAEFAATHPMAKGWILADALKGMGIPLHPAAERFYREKGILP